MICCKSQKAVFHSWFQTEFFTILYSPSAGAYISHGDIILMPINTVCDFCQTNGRARIVTRSNTAYFQQLSTRNQDMTDWV